MTQCIVIYGDVFGRETRVGNFISQFELSWQIEQTWMSHTHSSVHRFRLRMNRDRHKLNSHDTIESEWRKRDCINYSLLWICECIWNRKFSLAPEPDPIVVIDVRISTARVGLNETIDRLAYGIEENVCQDHHTYNGWRKKLAYAFINPLKRLASSHQ